MAEAAEVLPPPPAVAPPVENIAPAAASVATPVAAPVADATPIAPLAEAVPGFPLLPSSMPLPHDFVCEGTAWSAKRNPNAVVTPHPALLASRRDQW